MTKPLVSFIIPLYNYEHYVPQTIHSMLSQTLQDFEILICDDASKDRSVEVVRSFSDPRIKLLINEQNRGGAATYNRLVGEAQGEFIAAIDSDDLADPRKLELQIAEFRARPDLAILGTYVSVIDKDGNTHPDKMYEEFSNRPLDLNSVDAWIVQNALCHSSVTLRKSAHDAIGLQDPTMHYACDYEFWLRALRLGYQFDVLREKLCIYRVHGKNITHANLPVQFLEICYLMAKNAVPSIEQSALYSSYRRILDWVNGHEQFLRLEPKQRYRLFATFFMDASVNNFDEYRNFVLRGRDGDTGWISTGRRMFAIYFEHPYRLDAEEAWRADQLRRRVDEARRVEKAKLTLVSKVREAWVGISEADRKMIHASGLFDEIWYRGKYPDLSDMRDLVGHYLIYGWREKRSPGPEFDSAWYEAVYQDVAEIGMNPLLHYIQFGAGEGRKTTPPRSAPKRKFSEIEK